MKLQAHLQSTSSLPGYYQEAIFPNYTPPVTNYTPSLHCYTVPHSSADLCWTTFHPPPLTKQKHFKLEHLHLETLGHFKVSVDLVKQNLYICLVDPEVVS